MVLHRARNTGSDSLCFARLHFVGAFDFGGLELHLHHGVSYVGG